LNFIFDTSVLVSAALHKGSTPDQAFDRARRIGNVIFSDEVYAELKEVINRDKFKRYLRPIDESKFLSRFKRESARVMITHRVSACRDRDDNMYLELAPSGKADCIISGDPDLLVLNPFENISIISAKEFLVPF